MFTLLLIFVGCKDPDVLNDSTFSDLSETLSQENLQIRKAWVKSEMVYFESFENFSDSLKSLEKQDLKSLIEIQKANSFNSLYAYYENYDEPLYKKQIKIYSENGVIDDNLIILTSEGDKHIEEKVSYKALAFLLNERQEILIGNNLVKYDYDFFETTDLLTNKTEKKSISGVLGTSNKQGRISATNVKSEHYDHRERTYKIEVRDNSIPYCSNGGLGDYRARHTKRFLGVFFNNRTTYVFVNGNNQEGTVEQFFIDECVICSSTTQNNTGSKYCASCSTAEWRSGPCYSNHTNVYGQFSCADGVTRRLNL
jgi:hypothetical protein